jgi:FkbM family methyltransferase
MSQVEVEALTALHPDWKVCAWPMPPDVSSFESGALFSKYPLDVWGLVAIELLWRHGGVALAPQMRAVRPFDALIKTECFLTSEGRDSISTRVLGSRAGHPLLREVLDQLLDDDLLPKLGSDTLGVASLLLERALRGRDDVLVLPPSVLLGSAGEEQPLTGQPSRHSVCVYSSSNPGGQRRPESTVPHASQGKFLRRLIRRHPYDEEPNNVSFQSVSYLGNNRLLVRSDLGFPLRVIADDLSITPQLASGKGFEHELALFLKRTLRTGDWFVDVGANYGLHTVWAAICVGYLGRVIAYEPDAELVELVRQNAEMNGCGSWVTARPVAAWSSNGTLAFARHPEYRALSVAGSDEHAKRGVARGYENTDIQSVRLDSEIPAGVPIRVVKIDVEGGEAEVLEGLTGLLSQSRVDHIVLEAIWANSGAKWVPLLRSLEALASEDGAKLSTIDPSGGLVPVTVDEVRVSGWFPHLVASFC